MSNKIALGLCNTVDYEIVWNSTVIEKLISSLHIYKGDIRRPEKITSIREIVLTVLHAMLNCKGEEIFVDNSNALEEFAGFFQKKITLGGTATRASIALSKLSIPSCLHFVTINDHVRRLIPKCVKYYCSNTEDTHYFHLIVQYPAHLPVRQNDIDIIAIRPNRLMFQNNRDRQILKLNHRFFTEMSGEEKILLISGFNAIKEKSVLIERLTELTILLKRKCNGLPIFFESASFLDETFREKVFEELLPYVSTISMNEDEFSNARIQKSI